LSGVNTGVDTGVNIRLNPFYQVTQWLPLSFAITTDIVWSP